MTDDGQQSAFEWDGSRAQGGELELEPAPAPRRPRALALAAALVALAGAGTGVAVALSGGGGATGSTPAVLLDAEHTLAQAAGYRFTLAIQATADGQSQTITGAGAISLQPLSGAMTMTVAGVTVSERIVPPYVYVLSPATGSSWQRVEIPPLPTSATQSFDPQQMLQYLQSVAGVTSVGQETIDGVPTTHYHGTIDIERVLAAMGSASGATANAGAMSSMFGSGIPIDVWIDAQGQIRRVSDLVDLHAAGNSAQVSLTMDLSSYGPQPAVHAPPTDQVQAQSAIQKS